MWVFYEEFELQWGVNLWHDGYTISPFRVELFTRVQLQSMRSIPTTELSDVPADVSLLP